MIKILILTSLITLLLFFIPTLNLFGLKPTFQISIPSILVLSPIIMKYLYISRIFITFVVLVSTSYIFIGYPFCLIVSDMCNDSVPYYAISWIVDYLGAMLISGVYYIILTRDDEDSTKIDKLLLFYCPILIETDIFIENDQKSIKNKKFKKKLMIILHILMLCTSFAIVLLYTFGPIKVDYLGNNFYWWSNYVTQEKAGNNLIFIAASICVWSAVLINTSRYFKIIWKIEVLSTFYKLLCCFLLAIIASNNLSLLIWCAIVIDIHI
jgi:hypothetical protein